MNTLVNAHVPGLSQNARLITIACARAPHLVDALALERFSGREGVNELFAFELDVLGSAADADIDALVGAELSITLLQPDGSRRAWHGLCTQAGVRGADGGLARFRLRLEPALAQLAQRLDSHLFQDLDLCAIVAALLADYPAVRCTFALTRAFTPRPICTQYRETDLAFLRRLLASEGLNFCFEHDQDALQADAATGAPRHGLVIFDAAAALPAMPGGATLRFHGVRAADDDDAIDRWHARRTVQANAVAISSWDPVALVAPGAQQASALDAGQLPAMAIYDGSGERIATGAATPGGQASAHATLMLQALEQHNKLFEGAGAVRRLAPGHTFTLTRHDHYPDGANGFKVLWVAHQARNNLASNLRAALASSIEDGTYRNTFACVRDSVALVAPAAAAAHPCTAPGTQTALVVGLPDAVASTNRDHQVKVQFAWQRGARPNPGGLMHDSASGGNAPGNLASGAWVRVAEALAGPNWGSQFTPRIGTEVLVDFAEGDIDRPVIVGQLHNGVAPPPFPGGVDANANHAGVLSGIHSTNLDGRGYNQWQLDDTQDQVRTRLASSSGASELHLGHLVQQAYGASQRGAARGSGFELRTDAWAVLRGARGVLLTTSARAASGTGVSATQMDAQEPRTVLCGARALGDTLARAAAQHQVAASAAPGAAQFAFIDGIDPQAKGRFDGAVNGQSATKAKPGERALDPAAPVERFAPAAVLMDAASSVNWATPASHLVSAGAQLHWSTQRDLHLAAGATISAVSGADTSLFTHAGGLHAIAANGPVSLQAHRDQLEIVADKEVVVVSVNDAITIAAAKKVVLQSGQSSITLEGGDITFACPGNFTAKGGQHIFDGGASAAAHLTALPTELVPAAPPPGATEALPTKYDEQIVYKDAHGDPIANLPFHAVNKANTEQMVEGATRIHGQLDRLDTPSAQPLEYALRYTKFKFP